MTPAPGFPAMNLEFSGSPEITATRDQVWARLLDPEFVAASAPGVESVRAVDPTHFEVLSGLGVGSVRVRFVLDVEVFEIVDRQSLRMRALGKAPGSAVEVVSSLRIADDGPGKVRLDWSATTELRGTIAHVGPRLIEGIARRLTEFWTTLPGASAPGDVRHRSTTSTSSLQCPTPSRSIRPMCTPASEAAQASACSRPG